MKTNSKNEKKVSTKFKNKTLNIKRLKDDSDSNSDSNEIESIKSENENDSIAINSKTNTNYNNIVNENKDINDINNPILIDEEDDYNKLKSKSKNEKKVSTKFKNKTLNTKRLKDDSDSNIDSNEIESIKSENENDSIVNNPKTNTN